MPTTGLYGDQRDTKYSHLNRELCARICKVINDVLGGAETVNVFRDHGDPGGDRTDNSNDKSNESNALTTKKKKPEAKGLEATLKKYFSWHCRRDLKLWKNPPLYGDGDENFLEPEDIKISQLQRGVRI
jgi:hypothetical protein